ncbi:hypothetical protein SmJEL517_g02422 [Synchytrium microbalum]|uniref:Nudix hydrolase domain-containing protein n=1 Tax=Synchytrium microbalum TaxID=1806994 RepID=A0A507C7B7_9FUNG|nr:uncharacterized protein SmJEL517_g02422 [Synchytrium microbalum]TPX35029.1 hypothetical protein SmJEL517_g02422 [Synchytrium microbalum]
MTSNHSQRAKNSRAVIQCPICLVSLDTNDIFEHVPLYHAALHEPYKREYKCPLCSESSTELRRHIEYSHRTHPKRINAYSLVVCRRRSDDKYLLVEEVGQMGWWLPGGGVDIGESLARAGRRETLEEAGVDASIKGVIKVEYSSSENRGVRVRGIFYAEADEHALPKTIPDNESLSACWVDINDLDKLPLRSREPLQYFKYVEHGGAIHSLDVLA